MSTDLIDFQQFTLEKVIDESALTKSITFQGTYKGQTAVIRLEKTPFESSQTKAAIYSRDLVAERNLINDIYSRYKLTPPASGVSDLKAIVVIPANETVLVKYSRNETVLYTETASTYREAVEPFLANMLQTQGDYNLWVYNILDGLTEREHVFYNDTDSQTGFVLLPSLKSGDSKEPHVLAICHRRDIRSMRDLNRSHLPLLRNILEVGSKKVHEKYPESKNQLRPYVHYHPTFYHFHVHFELVDASEYKASDRDNLLISIINNIEILEDYYTKADLTYPLSKASALYKELATDRVMQKIRISDHHCHSHRHAPLSRENASCGTSHVEASINIDLLKYLYKPHPIIVIPSSDKMTNPMLQYFPPEAIAQCHFLCSKLFDSRCCSKLINNLDLTDQTCLKLFLIKTLGYGIIVLGSIVKLPQVLKIWKAKSGVGLSIFGVLLELMAITFHSSYSFRKGFPLSAWGEGIALAIETALIAYLVLWYEGSNIKSLAFVLSWLGILYLLNHPSLVPMDIIWYLESSVIYLAVSGKLMQAYKNYKAQHTGQLSAISAWAIFAGSMARILTTIQETGDMLATVSFIFSSCANCIIATQVLWYWQSTQRFIEKGKKKKAN